MTRVQFLLIAIIAAGAAWAQDAHGTKQPASLIDGSVTQFIVIARDLASGNGIENFSLTLDRLKNQGNQYSPELRCDNMGSIVLVHLSQGHWRFRVFAEGYDEEIFDGVDIVGKQGASQSTYAQESIESFAGTTVAIPVFLKKSQNNVERSAVHSFIDDTIYYPQTDVPPSPIGGIEALRKSITTPGSSERGHDSAVRTFSLIAFINNQGEVNHVQVTQGGPSPEFDKTICSSIQKMKFNPAKILGRPVGSRLSISFKFDYRGTEN